MRFDLIDLKLFVHIAESGSITAGAKLAHLSLPSASARIHGMEEGLKLALLSADGAAPSPPRRDARCSITPAPSPASWTTCARTWPNSAPA